MVARYAKRVLLAVGVLVAVCVPGVTWFMWCNPQLSRHIYLFQARTLPGRVPQMPKNHTGAWRVWATSSGDLVEEAEYRDGLLHGVRRTWRPGTGRLRSEEGFADGQDEGGVRFWHANGILEAEYAYKHGELDGVYSEYYSNGSLASRQYWSEGRPASEWRYWDEEGAIRDRMEFTNGTGRCADYWSSGVKHYEGQYVKGYPEGKWEFWDESGLAEGIVIYDLGRLVSSSLSSRQMASAKPAARAAYAGEMSSGDANRKNTRQDQPTDADSASDEPAPEKGD